MRSLSMRDPYIRFAFPPPGAGPIFEECRDPLVKLSALTAALVHDLNHPGYNNNFLRLTNDPLVQKFGGEAPSEHMHIALFEQLAAEPELDFLKPLGPSNRARLSTLVREMVLATDMPKHMQYIVAEFPKNPEQLLVAKLSLAMKTADLAHCIRNFKVHRKFVDMLKAEFYAQGDREKHYIGNSSLGMERDEKIEDIAKSQMNFLSVYIRPLYGKWQSLADFPLVSEMQASLDRNICSWEQLLPRQETAPHYIDAKASSKSSRRSTSQATSASNQRVVNLAQIYSMTSWNLMEIDAVLNQLWGGEDDTWLLRMSNSYPSLKPGDTDKMEGPPVVGARRFTVGSVLSV